MEQLQSHKWLTASSYVAKYLGISSYIKKPFLIYDFSTDPFWISLYMRKISFVFYQCGVAKTHNANIYSYNVVSQSSVQKTWYSLNAANTETSSVDPNPGSTGPVNPDPGSSPFLEVSCWKELSGGLEASPAVLHGGLKRFLVKKNLGLNPDSVNLDPKHYIVRKHVRDNM